LRRLGCRELVRRRLPGLLPLQLLLAVLEQTLEATVSMAEPSMYVLPLNLKGG
jgi:hypothetical protein